MKFIIKEAQIFIPLSVPAHFGFFKRSCQTAMKKPLGIKFVDSIRFYHQSIYKTEIDNEVYYSYFGTLYNSNLEVVGGIYKINPRIVSYFGHDDSNFSELILLKSNINPKLIKKFQKLSLSPQVILLPNSVFTMLTSVSLQINSLSRSTIQTIINSFLYTQFNINEQDAQQQLNPEETEDAVTTNTINNGDGLIAQAINNTEVVEYITHDFNNTVQQVIDLAVALPPETLNGTIVEPQTQEETTLHIDEILEDEEDEYEEEDNLEELPF